MCVLFIESKSQLKSPVITTVGLCFHSPLNADYFQIYQGVQ